MFTAICTFFLIWVGGVVTSHGAGMAVPDWPTTYGYNMFAYPLSEWFFTGTGISKEHSHRLVASGVGFLTTILAVWLWIKEERRWLRWLGVIAFVAVCVQGVLGGLRVTLYKDELGIFHATLAQLFLVLMSSIAFFLTRKWRELNGVRGRSKDEKGTVEFHPWFRPLVLGATILILGQLALGATMRHQHAGLAVPDFPLAYGKVWPPTDAEFLEEVNRRRHDYREFAPITAGQIHLHMAHRITACVILAAVGSCFVLSRKGGNHTGVKRFAAGWLGLIMAQAFLGAYTVWSNKAADIATAHVAVGALSLVWGSMLYIATAPLAKAFVAARPVVVPHGAPAMSS